MARKNKVRVDRIIILILVCILVLGTLGFGIYKLFGLFFEDNNKQTNIDPVQETTDGVNVTLQDYTVYVDEKNELGFNFIIAKLNFSANKAVSFELKNLQTSEKQNLSDVSNYIKKMEIAGYDINKLDINTAGIETEENNISANVFIPYKTDAYTLAVYNAINASKIEFDLSENNVLVTTLKLNNTDTPIEIGTNKVTISKSYISSSMMHNGDRYPVASTIKVYTFEINVLDAQENAYIEDAIYIEDGTNNEIHCYPKEYSAIDCENIVEKKLSSGLSGGLFFDVISGDNEIHSGTLLIKFSNNDTWIEIND